MKRLITRRTNIHDRTAVMGVAARLVLGAIAATALRLQAAEYTVDNLAGSDVELGSAEAPFKTLAKGLSVLRGGDTLHLVHNPGNPYREVIDSNRHPDWSGTAEQPTVIDGHGAVITGLKVFPADRWQAEGNGIFSRPLPNNAWVMDRQGHWSGFPIVFFDGVPAEFRKTKAELEPRTYYLHKERPAKPDAVRGPLHNTLYICLPEGKTPDDIGVETIASGTNVHINRDHVVVRNLTSQYAGVDGFATWKAKHVVFENVRGSRCMDQGMSNHGTEVVIRDSRFDGNAGCGIVDVYAGCKTQYFNCRIEDNIFRGGVEFYEGEFEMEDCIIQNNEGEPLKVFRGATLKKTRCEISGPRPEEKAQLSSP